MCICEFEASEGYIVRSCLKEGGIEGRKKRRRKKKEEEGEEEEKEEMKEKEEKERSHHRPGLQDPTSKIHKEQPTRL